MLKVGTDFSGIGSPEAALRRLNLPHKNVFACEIDKFAKESYLELNNPNTFYEDITTRNHSEVEQLDLYVAGFPCQAFSYAGKRKGFADEEFWKAQKVNSDTQLYKQAGNTITVNVMVELFKKIYLK